MEKFNGIAFVADSHFGARNFKKGMFEQMMLFFEAQFFPYLLENDIKTVIHCGDLVHNRNMIDLWFHQEIKKRFFGFFEQNKIDLHILVGNHDIYYKTTIDYNYLSENIQEFSHVHVYKEQEKIQIGKYTFLMVPWIINPKEFKFKDTADICCGHFDMAGFRMTKTQFSDEGFDLKEFAQFNMVFSGHYHIKSEQKNVRYLGCPYPITWNDYDEEQGFFVLRDNFKVKFIQNNVNATFLKIFYDEVDGEQEIKVGGLHRGRRVKQTKEEVVELAANNYLRVITKNIQNQMLFDNFYNSLKRVSRDDFPIDIVDANEIIESFDGNLISQIEEELAESGNEDLDAQFKMYLKGMTFEKDVDPSLLLNLFERIRLKAIETGNTDDEIH